MNYLMFTDKDGVEHRLTTESTQSSYGMPVYRRDNNDCGPADLIFFGDISIRAASVVVFWVQLAGRTQAEIQAAKKFCMQNPEGIQVD